MTTDEELDRNALTEINSGKKWNNKIVNSIDILSPDFFNMVTPINGAANLPTIRTNILIRANETYATNDYGINFVSINKYASQSNHHYISGILIPTVGAT